MRTHRIAGAVLATALLTGTVTAPAAFAAPPAATASVAQSPVPFTAATAARTADGGHTLSWASPAGSVTVTAVTSPDATTGTALGTAPGTGTLTVAPGTLPEAGRWYFRLVPDSGSPLVVADRSLGLESARNFRDIGGYRTTDGHWVRPGLVYRSNKLSGLTDADQQRLVSQKLTLDVDLRNAQERHDDPDRLPAGVTYQVADVVSFAHGIRFHDSALMTLAQAIAHAASSPAHRTSASPSATRSWSTSWAPTTPSATSSRPSPRTPPAPRSSTAAAGKDRTGWGTAVLLTLLGVPRETVEADFLASNQYTGNPKAVELSWLRAAFAEVDHIYGDFDTYVREGLKLDAATVATLRAKLLTD